MTLIGQRLKEERLRLKLSQSVLGSIGGVETNAQGNYESGSRFPRADYLSRISTTGIDVAYVVTGLRLPSNDLLLDTDDLAAMSRTPEKSNGIERLDGLIERLQGNLQSVITDLYQISRLTDSGVEPAKAESRKNQLDSIKSEAESIALATMRLIFVASRLN